MHLLFAVESEQPNVGTFPIALSKAKTGLITSWDGRWFPAASTTLHSHNLVGREAANCQTFPEEVIVDYQGQGGGSRRCRIQIFGRMDVCNDPCQTFKRKPFKRGGIGLVDVGVAVPWEFERRGNSLYFEEFSVISTRFPNHAKFYPDHLVDVKRFQRFRHIIERFPVVEPQLRATHMVIFVLLQVILKCVE